MSSIRHSTHSAVGRRSTATRASVNSSVRIRSSIRASDGRPSELSERVPPLEVVFRDLTFVVTDRKKRAQNKKRKRKDRHAKLVDEDKVILNHLNGMFRAGRLTAIMGPSGAGKTSLLDAVAGNTMGGRITGTITVNGEDYSGKKIKEISGFVFQDDVLLPTMTVREAIEQSAILRLPKSVTKEERLRRIDDIIGMLHLESCQDTKVGSSTKKGISGGERKRTSTAMELIANPPMLFLDEPTSGLDTFTAYTVVNSLSKLAKQGRTVVTTIHQPSSEIFHLFDDLLLLMNGSIVYYGPAKDSMDYFARLGYPCPRYSNPADFYFMEVLRQFEIEGFAELRRKMNPSLAARIESQEKTLQQETNSPDSTDPMPVGDKRANRLSDAWNASQERSEVQKSMDHGNQSGVAVSASRQRAPRWTQFKYLLGRASKNALRNPMIVSVQIMKAIFLGVITGLVYLNSSQYSVPVQIRNKSGAIFFIALNAFFGGVFGVLTVFFEEKQVFFREYKAGYYTTTPYFLSKFLVELPYNFLFPYLSVLIAYYMVGLRPAFSAYLLVATFAAFAAVAGVSLGMLLASLFNDFTVVLAVTPVILLPLLLLSGIFVNSESLKGYLEWIKYISPLYYATVGMLQTEFERDFPNCDSSRVNCDGRQGLDSLGMGDSLAIGVNLVLLITLWLALTISAYLVLVLLTRRRYKSA